MLYVLVVAFMIAVAVLYALVGSDLQVRITRKAPPAPPPPLDVRAARRHAHSLGLPFPEADGTVSWPGNAPALDQAVHDEIHARRMMAQFGMTGEQAAEALRANLVDPPPERVYDAPPRMLVPCSTCNGARVVIATFDGVRTKVRCGDCLAKS